MIAKIAVSAANFVQYLSANKELKKLNGSDSADALYPNTTSKPFQTALKVTSKLSVQAMLTKPLTHQYEIRRETKSASKQGSGCRNK